MHLSFLAWCWFSMLFLSCFPFSPVMTHVPRCLQVHFKFELMPETLYLMVTLFDRYLSHVQIKKSELQLVGLTALFLASKYEDFWHPRVIINTLDVQGSRKIFIWVWLVRLCTHVFFYTLIQIKDLISISAESYTRSQMLAMVWCWYYPVLVHWNIVSYKIDFICTRRGIEDFILPLLGWVGSWWSCRVKNGKRLPRWTWSVHIFPAIYHAVDLLHKLV